MRTIALIFVFIVVGGTANADVIYEFGGTAEVVQADSIYSYGQPAEYLRFEIRTGDLVVTTFGDDYIDFDVQQNASIQLALRSINAELDQFGNPIIQNRFRLDLISFDVLTSTPQDFGLLFAGSAGQGGSGFGLVNANETTHLVYDVGLFLPELRTTFDGLVELEMSTFASPAPTHIRISNMQIYGQVHHIPEPSAFALAVIAVGMCGRICYRRRLRATH